MMEFCTRISFILPNHRDNLDSLEEHKLKLERDVILPREYNSFYRIIGTIWIHENISLHLKPDGILHKNKSHYPESSGQSVFIRTYKLKLERDEILYKNTVHSTESLENLVSSEHK